MNELERLHRVLRRDLTRAAEEGDITKCDELHGDLAQIERVMHLLDSHFITP